MGNTIGSPNKLIKIEKAIPYDNEIRQAIKRGDINVVLDLLKNGLLDPNAFDKNRNTPLYWACGSGQYLMVQILIEKGAKINTLDNIGWTPLHVACQRGHDSIVEFLIKKGANINIPDKGGNTPLWWACKCQNTSIVKYLIDAGANIDTPDKGGITPVHWVCEANHYSIMKLLVDKGAKIDMPNKDGWTLLHIACFYERNLIVNLLLKKGIWITKELKEEFPKILTLDYRTQQILFLLYCTRKYNPDSVIGVDYLPRDIFKLILRFYIAQEKIDDL